ncbi:ethanolamine ammonia-lyase subunit EutC [Halanaerobium sp. Z-7514]|uniref:Ethanolamine ammonia-lyase small subunit n=1 Tax=Halanaerobium polyolivorans TaxID=2886943 RepID=A0AAW4WTL7_9FIRM|nr:ethanolamine ammonia-lyase subunit EutC [Halanaerobium polyolivorans]MCC3144336.1 ethanolamine ammonia-lyase subunit EutC [Halanaerobium polyolivorans]RQD69524.1 MAG: ethanolamine ammonia-lyase subunit EutC [Halanaerobium sp. MSAO_Bac5]
MVSENELKTIIEEVIKNLDRNNLGDKESNKSGGNSEIEAGEIPDITEVDLQKEMLVPEANNQEEFLKLKAKTSARLGVWRAGPRYKTNTLLRFRADHAAAMDAVFTGVSEELINEMNFDTYQTLCSDKDEFLTRPDLGKLFSDQTLAEMKNNCQSNPQVQLYVADGLSSTAIEANLRDIFPAIKQGLEGYNIEMGTPFFVKFGRVASMEPISECLNADVSCVLIGERPGLATAESMSCYMAYKAEIGMPEARRTVISNIHSGGTSAVEAGAHIADVIKAMLDQKASGLDLEI